MLLTAPDSALGELIATQTLLLQVWPDGAREVMHLVYVLRHLMPSLAGALALGVTVLAHPATPASLFVGYRRARLTATGCDRAGDPVPDGPSRLHDVTALEIFDLVVDGQPALQVTR